MATTRYITAQEAVTRVLKSMSLPVPVSVSSSSDPTTALLFHLLGQVGEDLVDKHEWQFFDKTLTITTVPGITRYALPSDFQNFVDSTAWNRTQRLPLAGPLTSQEWAYINARLLGGITELIYTIEGDEIVLYSSPSAAQSLSIAYKGKGWVRDGADPLVFKDRPAADADVILYAPRLIVARLKNQWRIEKGFDTLVSQQEADDALDDAKYNDKPKRDLNMVRRANLGLATPYVADTGFGHG